MIIMDVCFYYVMTIAVQGSIKNIKLSTMKSKETNFWPKCLDADDKFSSLISMDYALSVEHHENDRINYTLPQSSVQRPLK